MRKLKKDTKESIIIFFISLVIFFVIGFGVKTFVKPVIVNGNSMCPTLSDGDVLTGRKPDAPNNIKRGDIIVFSNESTKRTQYIKRIVGLPGEKIDIKDGYVYINEEQLNEYVYEDIEDAGTVSYPITLSDGQYFCLGDNRNDSVDSRIIGPINFDEIIYIVNNKETK